MAVVGGDSTTLEPFHPPALAGHRPGLLRDHIVQRPTPVSGTGSGRLRHKSEERIAFLVRITAVVFHGHSYTSTVYLHDPLYMASVYI